MTRHLIAILFLLLAALPASAQDACPPPTRFVDLAPVLTVRGPVNSGTDRRIEPFALLQMQAAAAWRGHRDGVAAERAVGEMLKWARANALGVVADAGVGGSNTNSIYSLRRSLIAILGSWMELRRSPAGQFAAAEIEPWLARLVALQDGPTGGASTRDRGQATSNYNNHVLLRATVEAQWATLANLPQLARHASDTARTMLNEMRPDGSLPRETARGPRALWYQRHALASLVYLAELLAPQGFDLWQPRADGVDLHRGVAFLLQALDHPELVVPYAGADDAHPQDLGFLEPRGHGRHYMAWAVLYRARFPGRAESTALDRLLPRIGAPGWPMVDDYVGGNTTCRVSVP